MPVTYARRLGLFSATMLVVGGIIGSGIFLNPAIVAQRVGTGALTLGAWVLGGGIAVLGSLLFAELGARWPQAGGGYVYLREAFGTFPAFLYAWALFLIIAPGAIAAVSVTFASYSAALLQLPARSVAPLAVGAILLLSLVNYLGVAPAAFTQSIFTVLKLCVILALIAAGLLGPGLVSDGSPTGAATGGGIFAFGSALVPVLFAYGGWQQTNFVAAELRDPERTLPRALVIGVAIVVVVYLLVNLAYLRILGPDGLAASGAPAADVMSRVLGPRGRGFIAAGIALSSFGFLDLVLLVSPRVYQTMAEDGLFFRVLARLHPRFRTPAAAIGLQAIWAVILTLTGTYAELLDYVVFADWIFFGLTAFTIFVFRRRDIAVLPPPHDTARVKGAAGFRAPGYPVTLVVFLASAFYVVAGSVTSNPANALKGTALLAAGIPAFLWWRGQRESGNSGTGDREGHRE